MRLHVPREAGTRSEHQGMEASAEACRHQGLPLARPEAHLGFMARPVRNSAARAAGTRRLEQLRDFAAVCASFGRTLGKLCREFVPPEGRGPHTFRHTRSEGSYGSVVSA